MARYDLDGWAKVLGAGSDSDAVTELRRWRKSLEHAQTLIRPVYLRSIELPDEHPWDVKRLLDDALERCYVVGECFGDVAFHFGRHERGER